MKKVIAFIAFAIAVFAAASAMAGHPRGDPEFHSSAVPPVEVQSGPGGDYVVDIPFPQWVSLPAPEDAQAGIQCLKPDDRVPAWASPLPVESIECAAENPSAGEVWISTGRGVIFLDLEGRRKLYFSGKRWLPSDDVDSIGITTGGDLLARTPEGNVLIARRMMTLEEKALLFENDTQERHNRDGMITDSGLAKPGDLSSFVLSDDDNDGQWTQMYLAGECFRYAATGDPAALDNARESFHAMELLLTVAPVEGYPARSVLPPEDCPGKDAERWRMHPTRDICWKSDTSVDELVGHYFGLPIYYDLVANEEEKARIRDLVESLTDYIVDNGMRLLDENGEVTTHGHWDPEWVNTVGRTGDQGLNSLDALNALRSAYHVTGKESYLDKYHELIKKHHYHRNVVIQKEISDRYQVNHDSDEMAFLSFYNLLRYEDDENLRKYYMEGLRRSWENDLPERNAEQIMIFGAFAKTGFHLDYAVRTLREIPLDLVYRGVHNSHRADIVASPEPDRFGNPQFLHMPPYTEVRTMRWSFDMYRMDVDAEGRSEACATFWLLPYWMARYHGMIKPPPEK